MTRPPAIQTGITSVVKGLQRSWGCKRGVKSGGPSIGVQETCRHGENAIPNVGAGRSPMKVLADSTIVWVDGYDGNIGRTESILGRGEGRLRGAAVLLLWNSRCRACGACRVGSR